MTTSLTTTARHGTLDTPLGPFTALVGDSGELDGVVLASGWTPEVAELVSLVHPDLRPAELRPVADLGDVAEAVIAFHDGDPRPAAAVQVHQRGGEFLLEVWARMREIEAGSPVTYSVLAERAGRPAAVRGAAQGCARNAAALFVPCHRVVRRGGGLGGFRWGLALKEQLLALEARPPVTADTPA